MPPHAHSMPSPDPALAGTSLDSGLGGDMEDVRGPGGRGSSEEKEVSLTPAQSRRKAQNRAAYVYSGSRRIYADGATDNELSASAKSVTSVTWKPNSQLSSLRRTICSLTMRASNSPYSAQGRKTKFYAQLHIQVYRRHPARIL